MKEEVVSWPFPTNQKPKKLTPTQIINSGQDFVSEKSQTSRSDGKIG